MLNGIHASQCIKRKCLPDLKFERECHQQQLNFNIGIKTRNTMYCKNKEIIL